MAITAWRCTVCNATVPLDHFATTDCGLVVPADYAAAVLADEARSESRAGRIGVSDLLSCPRKKLIREMSDVTIDPLDRNAMLTGTAWHALLAAANPADTEIEVGGTIDGITVVGHIDRMHRGSTLLLGDVKHTNDFSRKHITAPKPEHQVQVSLYAELYAQTFSERPAGGVIYYHFTTSPGTVAMRFDLWELDACLDHAPYGGESTVRSILHELHAALTDSTWLGVSLAGESMLFGSKTMCDYCEVKAACWTAAKGAPF